MRLKSIFFISAFCIQGLYALNENIDKYLGYLPSSNFGQIGDHRKGEMQIVDSYDAILEIQQQYYNEFIQKGCSPVDAEKYSRIGVVDEDRYWIWFRDPLILPSGKTTAYNRFFSKNGLNGAAGVSVMGISKENKVLVNVIFRHATREWELELPRGGRGKNESSEEAALRELQEETGVRGNGALKIASIASDSGILANTLDVFVVSELSFFNEMNREDCEIIHECILMTKQELKQAFVNGYVQMEMNGDTVKVLCRDPFLASALLIAEAKGML